MQLGDALKKTAKKSKKVKSVRTRATVAHKDRPYTNDISKPKKIKAKRPERTSAVVGGLLRSFAEDTLKNAKEKVTSYQSKLEKPLQKIAKFVKSVRK